MSQQSRGEPEDQLRAPFETLFSDIAEGFGWDIVCTGETPLPDRLGRPDYAVHLNRLLAGYVETKAPGSGANTSRFKGRNRQQWNRFRTIPNLLYTDGNEWALYRSGEIEGSIVRLAGDIETAGAGAVSSDDAARIERLLREFLAWRPIVPLDSGGRVQLRSFAEILAPLCRLLRDDVADAVGAADSPLHNLAADWRQLLFPDADDAQFADAYAQTVTFGLLLARAEGADPFTLETAKRALSGQHGLLSRALEVLTDTAIRDEMSASLNILVRVLGALPSGSLDDPADPWLYFYEEFLAAYDPKLRRDAGAYYTPIQVVRAQVRLVDELLKNRFRKPLGFADPEVVTLDPAAGTGTYLLAAIDYALRQVETEQGAGSVPAHATALASNLHGFEQMVGPYAVAELRVSSALRSAGAALPSDGPRVYLTDTLESPFAQPAPLPLFFRPIAEQRIKAFELKSRSPVLVCMGNPPYDRHAAANGAGNLAKTGGWVRWGDPKRGDRRGGRERPILQDFLDPLLAAKGGGVHAKNLYNLYVYFWRWALWKVFESETAPGPGVVTFISAASYLTGDAFRGMREVMRRLCDEIWILDLGGEGRGTRQDENVFDIQTPVAIAVAARTKPGRSQEPARVRYFRVEGSRADKLAYLDTIASFDSVNWTECPTEWHTPFQPGGRGAFFDWPALTDLMPWQISGSQFKRTWPIAADRTTLSARWRALLGQADRVTAFVETRDRSVESECRQLGERSIRSPAIGALGKDAAVPPIRRYSYRSFDRQWVIADNRVADYIRPALWMSIWDRQVFFAGLFGHPLGNGPALTVSSFVPDMDCFRGSFGSKGILPLYRESNPPSANLLPGLPALLTESFGVPISPEDVGAYLYALLAHPEYTRRFEAELASRQVRVPLTKDPALFDRAKRIGARLIWLHTFGERFAPDQESQGRVPNGSARCIAAIPESPDGYPASFSYIEATSTLKLGGGEFRPVTPAVYEFEVSGLKVVQSWLKYRMRDGAGRRSSPLDRIRPTRWSSAMTTELLELLWVLEATVAGYPEQADLLDAVVAGPCFASSELPPVPEYVRRPPPTRSDKPGGLYDDIESERRSAG